MVSSKAFRFRSAPLATTTVAVSDRRSAVPSDSVPPVMATASEAEAPFSVETPETWNRFPAPRLAFTVAALSWYSPAVSVPVPFSVPDRARMPTVSLKAPRSRIAPVATLTPVRSDRTSDAPRTRAPPSMSVTPV